MKELNYPVPVKVQEALRTNLKGVVKHLNHRYYLAILFLFVCVFFFLIQMRVLGYMILVGLGLWLVPGCYYGNTQLINLRYMSESRNTTYNMYTW